KLSTVAVEKIIYFSCECLFLFVFTHYNNAYFVIFDGCLTGYVTLGSHIHHEYHLINEAKSWFEARNYCSSHYTDLATIGSHGDMKRLVNQTAASGVTAEIWIGLTESGPASWLWSVGETSMSHKLAEYSNWDSSPDSSHHCGGMRTDGKWLSTLCQTALPFVCQEGE
uniref:C-type lectin domain-containing protein n=1 Tax=Lates calcarifer TaxID=8187 RepID=A0A4W6G4T0_LATCA